VYVEVIERDVACVCSWGIWKVKPEIEYGKLVLPQVPLLLATLSQEQFDLYKGVILREGWREVGWYPTCHDNLDDGFKMRLMCKEQKVPLPYEGGRGVFNDYVPLSCSCVSLKTRVKLTPIADFHRIMGVHRMTEPCLRRSYNNWRRFADTPLASYWFWGLLPTETDRHKYE
jgi:hypothetical protein